MNKRKTTPAHLKNIKIIQYPHVREYNPDIKKLLVAGDNVDFYMVQNPKNLEIFRVSNGQRTHVLTINKNRLERNHVLFETMDCTPTKRVMLEFKSNDAISALLANLPIYDGYDIDYNEVSKDRYFMTGKPHQNNGIMYNAIFSLL